MSHLLNVERAATSYILAWEAVLLGVLQRHTGSAGAVLFGVLPRHTGSVAVVITATWQSLHKQIQKTNRFHMPVIGLV